MFLTVISVDMSRSFHILLKNVGATSQEVTKKTAKTERPNRENTENALFIQKGC
jgi:hypothetical protein